MSGRFPTREAALDAAAAQGAKSARINGACLIETRAYTATGGWRGRWRCREHFQDGGGMPRYRDFGGEAA